MSEYRIIKVVNIENKPWGLKEEVVYRPQYKRFFFWNNFVEKLEPFGAARLHPTGWEIVEFTSLEAAESFLDRQGKIGYYEQEFNYKANRGK